MKGNLLQGTARGRMGDIVAKVVHGRQILAKYQPVVANPRTKKQTETRETFANASKIMAEIRNHFKANGIHPSYAPYSGASKSLQNIVTPFVFLHDKITKQNGNFLRLTSNPPLIGYSDTGNDFRLEYDDDNSTLVLSMPGGAPGMRYFGSNIPLGNGNFIGFALSSNESNYPQVSLLEGNSLEFIKQDKTEAVGKPKAYGFKDTVSEVGDWNFIYQVVYPVEIGADPKSMPFSPSQKQRASIVVIYNYDGKVFFAGNYNELVSI